MLEHPDITRANLTGYPHGDPEYPICPLCGAECETIYINGYGEIIGCDDCTRTKSAWDVTECFSDDLQEDLTMKTSELFHLAQIAVVNSPCISPENKLEVLRELMEREKVELFCEKNEGGNE